jgi:hypothetical protein
VVLQAHRCLDSGHVTGVGVRGATGAEEDDAERAVRAALELVYSVAEFGLRKDIADLRARAGVVTGQVASWTSVDEGLVAGDRVNTAAPVQALADPGQVLEVLDEMPSGRRGGDRGLRRLAGHLVERVVAPGQMPVPRGRMAFWALAEMVRQRFDISEDEPRIRDEVQPAHSTPATPRYTALLHAAEGDVEDHVRLDVGRQVPPR